ncbi:MAG: PKD domain-containing protein [Microthrixaceae bacterium]
MRGTRSRHDRTQEGASLIEVLVALFLISVLIVALVNGLLTSTRATTESNRVQRTGSALTSMGELLKQMDYVPCANVLDYQSKYNDLANDPLSDPASLGTLEMDSVTIDKVEYWRPGSFSESVPTTVLGDYIPTCDFPEGGAQRVTYTVKWGPDSKTGEVVKRDPFAGGFLPATTTTAPPPASQRPVARFTATPVSGASPLTVNFDAGESFDPNGVLTAYDWNFKDGATATGETTSHTFTNPGKFIVSLTVTDSEVPSLTATTTLTINVTGKPATPTGLHKIGSGMIGVFAGYLDLGWNAVPGAQNYQVHAVSLPGWGVFECSITQDAGTSNKVRFTTNTWCSTLNLIPGISLKAKVRVKVGAEWSDWSPEVSVQW